ncbi:very short patch repair endonuclease [Flavobacterium sp. RSP46]|uniref:very short patch repair endonuclease n=1 Tax=Flavobacterium sp. RSP46 TaxID=2497486 RepID=UPI000F8650F8|nr:very short patch repair endonuclease [Flavobacterium sp. RSP46]RTY89489.1 very short patch repair endonuclease [Flavobacterium sp. RSP46]
MDFLSIDERRKRMQSIKSRATKDEIRLAKALWHLGYRYRKNNKTIFGTPDLTFKKFKIAIFVDSEFFHGKDWETQKDRVKTNTEFWQKKIERNMQRDIEVNNYLESQNWKALRFWSAEIEKNLEECVVIIQSEIISRQNQESES